MQPTIRVVHNITSKRLVIVRTRLKTLEDCRLAASAFGLSVAQPITTGSRPQGCWIGLTGDVWFNNMPNSKTCDEEQIQFCFCRTSALHCRTQMERPSTETLTPPAYQRDEGIFSKSGASDLSSAEVADSLPFHTEFTVESIHRLQTTRRKYKCFYHFTLLFNRYWPKYFQASVAKPRSQL